MAHLSESGFVLANARQSLQQKASHILDTGIFFSLLAIIFLSAVPYGTVQPFWEGVFECVLFGLGILWVIEGLLGRSWKLADSGLLAPILAIVLLATLQAFNWSATLGGALSNDNASKIISADPFETRLFILKALAICLYGQLLLRYTYSTRRLRSLVYVVLSVGIASALFGIARQMLQADAPTFLLPGLRPKVGYGQFINYNHFAFLMEMCLGLVLGLMAAGGVERDHRPLCLAAAAPVAIALVMSNSRGGIFAMLTQVVFISLALPLVKPRPPRTTQLSNPTYWSLPISRSFIKRALAVGCLMVVSVVAVIWIGGDPLLTHVESLQGDLRDESPTHENIQRPAIWAATWKLIQANPILGVGFGGYGAAISQYHDASGAYVPQQAHNDYLELAASGGIVGSALGLWFVIAFIRRSCKQLRSNNAFHRSARLGALVGIFGIAVHSLFDFGLHVTVNALAFTSLTIIAIANPSTERPMNKPPASSSDRLENIG
jgi:O-antigen ligase